jgi:hypothetical protein
MPVQHLKTIVTAIENTILALFVIWQMIQLTGYMNPFRGWATPLPQLIASTLILAYFPVKYLIQRTAKYKLKAVLIAAVPLTIVMFFLSFNIVLGFNPGRWFLEPSNTFGRLQLTLAFYSFFVILLAVVIALLHRLKPGG